MTTRTIHVAALAIVTIATAAGCRALPSVASDPGVRLEDAALEQKLRQAMTDGTVEADAGTVALSSVPIV